jgi:hypothetical protein
MAFAGCGGLYATWEPPGRVVWQQERCSEALSALSHEAAKDLDCPPESLVARPTAERDLVEVTGCGRRGLYMQLGFNCFDFATAGGFCAPHYFTTRRPDPMLFVFLTEADDAKRLERLRERKAERVQQAFRPTDAFRDIARARVYMDLLSHGANALACPVAELSPWFSYVPDPSRPRSKLTWVRPSVDGCGKRATYKKVQREALAEPYRWSDPQDPDAATLGFLQGNILGGTRLLLEDVAPLPRSTEPTRSDAPRETMAVDYADIAGVVHVEGAGPFGLPGPGTICR